MPIDPIEQESDEEGQDGGNSDLNGDHITHVETYQEQTTWRANQQLNV